MTNPAKLRALVLEDEWPARNYLVELLQASGLADVVGAVATLEQARQALTEPTVDVAFVDLQLAGSGDKAGLEFVRAFKGSSEAPMFVLATAYREHALEAFDLGVVDYLLKPFTEERVEQCLNHVLLRRPASEPNKPLRIVARRGRSLVFLDPQEIWAFEASGRLTSVHTVHGQFDVDLSLAAIEASIGKALTRVHRNWLVNAAHIRELEREGHETRLFVSSGLAPDQPGLRIPVARERTHAIREMLLSNSTGLRRT